MSWDPQYNFVSNHSLTWSGGGDVPSPGFDNITVQDAEFSDPDKYLFNSTFPNLKLALQYEQGSLTGFNWNIFDPLGTQALEGPDGTGIYDFNLT